MNRYRALCLVLLLFIAAPDKTVSQQLPFRVFSIEQGLSESTVNTLYQDPSGYLWIGTGYGLNRYDGVRNRTWYQHHGLNDNQINAIAGDEQGRLWIATGAGVNIMEEDTLKKPAYLEDLKYYSITALFRDRSGDWWFGSDRAGVWLLDGQNELTQYSVVHGLAGDQVRDIEQTADGIVWFATDAGLTSLEAGNFTTFTAASGLPDSRINALEQGADGRLWIGTEQGLVIHEQGEFTTYRTEEGLSHNNVLSISLEDENRAWLGTESGVSRFDHGHFESYTMEQGLTANIVQSTLIDREGHIWFGTMGGGANLLLGDYFSNYTPEEGVSSNLITGFDEDSAGNFWISSFGGGVMVYDGMEMRTFDESDGLIDNQVYTIYSDPEDRVWVGTRSGISVIEDGRIRRPEAPYRDPEMVRSFYADEETGELWVGTHEEGVYRFGRDTVRVYNDTNYLDNNTVMHIEKDPSGRIWFATFGGVVVLHEGRFERYTIEDGLPSNGVMSILPEDDGYAWVSTFNGFARLDTRNRIAQQFPSSAGLSGTMAHFMIRDDSDSYWIGTNVGIIHFDYEMYQTAVTDLERTLSFRLINREQGLVSNELNPGAVYRDRSGSIWFGTVEGVSRFWPDRLSFNNVPPIVHLEEVVIAGEPVDPADRLTLGNDRNFLQFEVSGISFEGPSRVLFEHRLEGVDDQWVNGYERIIRYPSLSPGTYSFQIRAWSPSGIQSETVESFSFEILPPFWLQWWFLLLLLLVLAAILLFIFNFTTVRRQVEMERMRVQIASDLHDDVGSSLTELALQTDFLRTGDLEQSVENTLKQIGEHSRRIVSTLDDIVWSIDARSDTAGDLTDRMQDHAHRILAPKGVILRFELSDLDMGRELPVHVKENLYLIYKEAVNNIAKHSDADRVEIELSMQGNRYQMKISDNGSLEHPERKSGQGLHNMNMRAQRIGANAIIMREKGFHVLVEGDLK